MFPGVPDGHVLGSEPCLLFDGEDSIYTTRAHWVRLWGGRRDSKKAALSNCSDATKWSKVSSPKGLRRPVRTPDSSPTDTTDYIMVKRNICTQEDSVITF